MTQPRVSVLMAARNHAAFAADAVASVLEQDYEPLELIAIDDASDDATADILEDCAAAAPRGRMIVIRHERQEGIAATRAHALRLAEGDFIGLLDSDDLWLPGKVRPQVELLAAEPTAGLTHAAFEAFNSETGEPIPWEPEWDLEEDELVELVRRGCFVMTGTTLIRRAAMDTRGIGFVTLDYPSYDDYLLFLAIALDWRFAYEPRTVMRYRRHQGNLTNLLFAQNLARARVNLLAEFLQRFPEARARLGAERRRTLARLLIRAAVYDRTRDPARAAGSVLSGLGQHPVAALDEITSVLRNRRGARAA
jgi:glycosyltransferase involved in cell wall biosynthesis